MFINGFIIVSLLAVISAPTLLPYINSYGLTDEQQSNMFRVIEPKTTTINVVNEEAVLTLQNTAGDVVNVDSITLKSQDKKCQLNVSLPFRMDKKAMVDISISNCIGETSKLTLEITGMTNRASLEAGSMGMYAERMKRLGADDKDSKRILKDKKDSIRSIQDGSDKIGFYSKGNVDIIYEN